MKAFLCTCHKFGHHALSQESHENQPATHRQRPCLVSHSLNEPKGRQDSSDDVKAGPRTGLPSAGEEAGDAGNVEAVKVAEEDLAEVQVNQWLQRLDRCGPLQRKQGAVVMHCNVHLPAVRLHATSAKSQ